MKFLHNVEKSIEGPIAALPSLPSESKRGLSLVWPWLALGAGVMQVLTALWLYQWALIVNDYINWVNSTPELMNANLVDNRFTIWVWMAIIILLIDALILLIAFPRLIKKQKSGWDLLLLAAIINLIYGFISIFIDGRGMISGLLGALIGSLLGIYLLFQVREFYGGKLVIVSNKTKTRKTVKKTKG